jgi:hypothetical protein
LYKQLSIEDQNSINLKSLLDNVRIEDSPLYGEKIVFHYNEKVGGTGLNVGLETLIEKLKPTVAENGSVFQIEISHNVTSLQHGNTARHANEIVGSTGAIQNAEASNTTGTISLTQIYYPEENDLVLNKFV